MKKIGFFFLLMAAIFAGYSQSDTLFTKSQKKIPCKITEIGDVELKYKLLDNLDGPVFTVPLTKLYRYTLSNGISYEIELDELSVENEHLSIIDAKSVIKIHPFSFVNNQISFAYEQVIRTGMNLDIEAGYINNNILSNTASYNFQNSYGKPAFMTGFYTKPGLKFMLGQDYSLKGMRYAHPLKGRYFRIDAVVSYLYFQDVSGIIDQSYHSSGSYGYTITTRSRQANINTVAFGGMINYGRQFILGNLLTFEYYIGAGVTGQSNSYSDEKITTTTYVYDPNNPSYGSYPQYYGTGEATQVSNYHGFFRLPNVGLSGSFGIRLGYIMPEKKPMPKVE